MSPSQISSGISFMWNILPRQRRAAKVHDEAVTVVNDIHKIITELIDSKEISDEERAAISKEIGVLNQLMKKINTVSGCKKIKEFGTDFIPAINDLLKNAKDNKHKDTVNNVKDSVKTVKIDMGDPQKEVDEVSEKKNTDIKKTTVVVVDDDEFADCASIFG